MAEAQLPRPVGIQSLPVELLLVIIQAAHSSYEWTAVRDRQAFIIDLGKVSRRFREISLELRNKVVFLDLPCDLEFAEASGRLHDIVLEAKHITALRVNDAGYLLQSTPPPPRPQPGPLDFLFTEARDPLLARLAPSASTTFSALRSLHLVDVEFVPPFPTRLPHLKFLRLGFIVVDKAALEAWLTPAVMPALVALRYGVGWQMPSRPPHWFAPDLDEGLIAQLDAIEFDEDCFENWQASRLHDRVAILQHIPSEDFGSSSARHALFASSGDTWQGLVRCMALLYRGRSLRSAVFPVSLRDAIVAASTEPLSMPGRRIELPFIVPDDLRLAARELFRRRDAGELDVLWYDDDDLGEELICAVWWRYILERKASAAALASEGEGRSV